MRPTPARTQKSVVEERRRKNLAPWWWAPPRQGRGRSPRAAARGRARRSATGRGRGFGAAGPRLLAALGSSARAERIQRESVGKRGRNRGRAELGDWQQPWWCPAPATVDGERGWCSGTRRRRRSRMAALGGAAPASCLAQSAHASSACRLGSPTAGSASKKKALARGASKKKAQAQTGAFLVCVGGWKRSFFLGP